LKFLVFLDFDGVICDSIDECLVSSWYGYYHLYKEQQPVGVPLILKERFLRLRPFIRSGEDYMVIQELLAADIRINNQLDFDRQLETAGKQKLELYKVLFYEARTYYLKEHPDYWFSLNPIYGHLKSKLSSLGASPFFYILSTKKADFILAILKNNGITMNRERIIYSAAQQKLSLIGAILDKRNANQALLLDDQIEHLSGNRDPRIQTFLCLWGYIKEEWSMGNKDIKPLTTEGFTRLINDLER
jgi:superfamily I DNA and/or RNA helicase